MQKSLRMSILLCLAVFVVASTITRAATITSAQTGTWNVTTTWVGGIVPTANDSVVIASGHNVTLSTNAPCAAININIVGTLTINANVTLTVAQAGTGFGTVDGIGTISAGTVGAGRVIDFNGDWSFSGTISGTRLDPTASGSNNQSMNSPSSGTLRTFTINKPAGMLSLNGNITVTNLTIAVGTCNPNTRGVTGSGTLSVTGTLIVDAATFAGNYTGFGTHTLNAGSTVHYTNANPTIDVALTYHNLTFSGSGSASLSGATLTVQGNLSNTGGGILAFGSGNVTITGTLATQNIAGFSTSDTITCLKTAGTATFTGAVSGGSLTVNGAGGTLDLGTSLSHAVSGNVTLTAGTLNGGSSTLNVGGAWTGAATFTAGTGTITFNAADNQTLPTTATTFHHLTLSNSGIKTLGSNTTVNGTLSLRDTATFASSSFTLTYGGSAALEYKGSTVQTTGSELPSTVPNLIIDNGNGVNLNSPTTVSGTLTLTNGILRTNGNRVIIGASGFVSRTNGYIAGTEQKVFSSGMQSFTFTIGDTVTYTPLSLSSFTVTSGGDVTVSTTGSEHPNIATSGIDPSKSVNRYWSLTAGSGLAFTTCNAEFNFVSGDLDVGATTGNFVVRRYVGSWFPTTTGTRTATSTQAVGLTSFSDFAIGEQEIDHYSVSAASPQTAGIPFATTVVAKDLLNETVVADSSTVVTMSGTGSVQFDSNGDGIFGDNTKTLVAGTFAIDTKDSVAETISITATDGNSRTGAQTNVIINPGSAWGISLTSGDNQSGIVGTTLSNPFIATVTDTFGNPVQGVPVTFAIASTPPGAAGQALSVYDTTTNDSGMASTVLTLGDSVGIYTVTATSAGLMGSPVTFTAIAEPLVGVALEDVFPKEFRLHQNYPNPFNPNTRIGFQISDFGLVSLSVYNLLGQEVATLVYGEMNPGSYEVTWDASGQPSGLYFYRLRTGDPSTSSGQGFTETKKMLLLK